MKKITYEIKDKNGIHARPAGLIVQCAKGFGSVIKMEQNGKSADCKKVIQLMQLGVTCGDSICITAEGTDEDEAVQSIYRTMQEAGL